MGLVKGIGDGDARIIRDAMLDAQSNWLTAADVAATSTERAVALVIADAFKTEAEKYKTKETHFHDVEYGLPQALSSLGEGS